MLRHGHEGIVARSPAMKQCSHPGGAGGRTDATVLLSGETGTGKELMARTIHSLSRRKDRPLITINCAVLPPTLIESELFGREKGAYTGALTRMAGRFEVAHRSTLFLDEIGELTLDLQAKLLRVIEEGRFERLGSTKPLQVDVRIIAATNRDLAQEVAAGRFRSDLYYRLSVFPILIPPLRERPEDIPPLVWAFVRQNEKKLAKRVDRIPAGAWKPSSTTPGRATPGASQHRRARHDYEPRRKPDVRPPISEPTRCPPRIRWRRSSAGTSWPCWTKPAGASRDKDGAAEVLGLKRTTLQAKMKKLGIHGPPHDAQICGIMMLFGHYSVSSSHPNPSAFSIIHNHI